MRILARDSSLWKVTSLLLLLLGVSKPSVTLGAEPTPLAAATSVDEVPRPASARDFVDRCRTAGFDPLQLACATCDLLPQSHRPECRSCCQSYRTLAQRTKRYGAAVLFRTDHPESVGEFVREDADQIREQKGGHRFRVVSPGDGDHRRWRYQPSAVFWFDAPLDEEEELSLEELAHRADDTTLLDGRRGLGRDDLRDMITTLLPDKESSPE